MARKARRFCKRFGRNKAHKRVCRKYGRRTSRFCAKFGRNRNRRRVCRKYGTRRRRRFGMR
jgi:hypothetical protein